MNHFLKYRMTVIHSVLLLSVVLFFLTTGCKKSFDTYYSNTSKSSLYVYDKLKLDTNFSMFTEGLSRVGLVSQINSGGLYTVFAPVNSAFRSYLAAKGYATMKDVPIDTLYPILNFHLLNNLWYYYTLKQYYTTYSKVLYLTRGKKFLRVDVSAPDTIKVNGIPVINSFRDISADNAVIHGIGTVLIPNQNLEQLLAGDPYFKNSTFYRLMQVVADSTQDRINTYDKNGDGILDSVFYKTYTFLSNVNTSIEYKSNTTTTDQGGTPVFTTILMPIDDSLNAFIAPALARIDNSVSNKIAALSPTYVKGVLSPYFVTDDSTSYTFNRFITKPAATNYLATNYQIIPTLTAPNFVRADVSASNGMVQLLNRNFPASDLLLSALGQASMDPDLSTFMLALQKAGLTGTYGATGTAVTFFAPTNAVFKAANFDVQNMILDGVSLTASQFSNIIKNHIISQNLATAVTLTGSIATVYTTAINTLTFSNNGTNATTTPGVTANISLPYSYKSIGTSSGYLYKVDKLLIPYQY